MSKQSVLLGVVVAGVCWWYSWPQKEGRQNSERAVPLHESDVREVSDFVSLLEVINHGQDLSDRAEAVRGLRKVNEETLEEMLTSLLPSEKNGKPSLAMIALLLEWVGRDPERAVAWAWQNLRDSKNWPAAFKEMGVQWAWDDPDGLLTFLKEHLVFGVSTSSRPSFQQLQASKKPVIGGELATEAKGWLRRSSIRAAFQMQRYIGTLSLGEEIVLSFSLTSVEEFAEALSAWDDYDPLQEQEARVRLEEAQKLTGGYGTPESLKRAIAYREYQRVRDPKELKLVQAIINRWKETDEDSFRRSQYVEWEAEE